MGNGGAARTVLPSSIRRAVAGKAASNNNSSNKINPAGSGNGT